MVLILNLNMTVDKTMVIKNFKKGYSFRKNPDIVVAGGKGINVARALKNYYSKYSVIGFICGYTGKLIEELGKKEKINLNLIYQKDGESRTCLTVVDKNGINTDINEEGPNINKKSIKEFHKILDKKKLKANILCVSGRSIAGVKKEFYENMLKKANSKGIETFCDLSGPILKDIVYFTNTLKINKHEFFELSGLENTVKNIKDVYDKYTKYKLKNLIVTDREKDIIAIINNEIYLITPPKIKVVSSVGSGDSFMAGLIYSFIMKYNYKNMLKTATSFAVSDCLTLGAGMVDKTDIDKYFNRIKVIKL